MFRSIVAFAMLLFMNSSSLIMGDESSSKFERPSIGIRVVPTESLRETYRNLPKGATLIVGSVTPNGPADKARIAALSTIATINKKAIKTPEAFTDIIGSLEIGKTYELSGFVPYAQDDGKVVWKKGSTKIVPDRYGNVVNRAMRIESDSIKNTKVTHYAGSPEFVNDRSSLHAYIMETGSAPYLRLKCQLVDKEFYGIRSVILKADQNEAFTITPPIGSTKTDIDIGKVSEWFDIALTDEQVEYLQKISNSRDTIIRIDGYKFSDERSLSISELDGIRLILDALEMKKSQVK
jgi:hypothetical protein